MQKSGFVTKYHTGGTAVWFEPVRRIDFPGFTHRVYITAESEGGRPVLVHKDLLDSRILRPGPKAAGYYLEKYTAAQVKAAGRIMQMAQHIN